MCIKYSYYNLSFHSISLFHILVYTLFYLFFFVGIVTTLTVFVSVFLCFCVYCVYGLKKEAFNQNRFLHHTKRQICSILLFEKDKIKIKVVPIQQQKNGVDCVLFAIAFVQNIIVNKTNPKMVTFDQSKMPSHALKAIETGRLDMTSPATVKR